MQPREGGVELFWILKLFQTSNKEKIKQNINYVKISKHSHPKHSSTFFGGHSKCKHCRSSHENLSTDRCIVILFQDLKIETNQALNELLSGNMSGSRALVQRVVQFQLFDFAKSFIQEHNV